MKICTNTDCPYGGAPQPTINFTSQLHTKDGLRTHCKRCRYLWQGNYSKEYRKNILRLYRNEIGLNSCETKIHDYNSG